MLPYWIEVLNLNSVSSSQVIQMQDEEAAVVAEDQPDEAEALSKLQKLLDTERMLKQQAVNKLAEIMARKDFKPPTKKVINTLILIVPY